MKFKINVDDTRADPELDSICAQIRADTGLIGRLVYQLDVNGDTIRAHCFENPRHIVRVNDERRIPTYVVDVPTPDWLLALAQ